MSVKNQVVLTVKNVLKNQICSFLISLGSVISSSNSEIRLQLRTVFVNVGMEALKLPISVIYLKKITCLTVWPWLWVPNIFQG